jgi:hypothetical protein
MQPPSQNSNTTFPEHPHAGATQKATLYPDYAELDIDVENEKK